MMPYEYVLPILSLYAWRSIPRLLPRKSSWDAGSGLSFASIPKASCLPALSHTVSVVS